MHRTYQRPGARIGAALLALLVLASAGLRAQDAPNRPTALVVPIGGTTRLQMSSKKPIKEVINPKENVISIKNDRGDPTVLLITGQQPDVTTLKLTDVDGLVENFEIIVQLDIEYLKTQLRRTVPTANVTPIPTSNNAVILTGTVTRAEDVNVVLQVANSIGGIQVINAMRVGGVQQVQLDVVVAAVRRNNTRSIGFDFLTSSQNFFYGSTTAGAVGNPASTGVGGVFSVYPALLGLPTGNSNMLFGTLHSGWGFLGYLQALRTEGMARLLAQPTLITLSGRPASFLVGGEQAVPVPAGLGQVGVQFEEFGTRLNFLPIVLGNGKIHLEVEPEISQLSNANGVAIQGTVVPGRDTNRINTTVQLEAGQTFVIGGIIRQTSDATTRKSPILGDLPFFGVFFSAKSASMVEEELVMLVTPHLVDAQDCNQVVKVLPGQETRMPDDFELFLEGILEAPRGPREVCQDFHYVPAFKNSPSMEVYPCTGNGTGLGRGHGIGGCGPNGCGVPSPVVSPAHPTMTAPVNSPAALGPTVLPPLGVSATPRPNPAAQLPGTPLPPLNPAPVSGPVLGGQQ